MLKAIGIILVALLISACTPTVTPIAYDCPAIILPPDPLTPVTKLTANSTPDVVVKSWVATAAAYRDWARIVKQQIKNSGRNKNGVKVTT